MGMRDLEFKRTTADTLYDKILVSVWNGEQLNLRSFPHTDPFIPRGRLHSRFHQLRSKKKGQKPLFFTITINFSIKR